MHERLLDFQYSDFEPLGNRALNVKLIETVLELIEANVDGGLVVR